MFYSFLSTIREYCVERIFIFVLFSCRCFNWNRYSERATLIAVKQKKMHVHATQFISVTSFFLYSTHSHKRACMRVILQQRPGVTLSWILYSRIHILTVGMWQLKKKIWKWIFNILYFLWLSLLSVWKKLNRYTLHISLMMLNLLFFLEPFDSAGFNAFSSYSDI